MLNVVYWVQGAQYAELAAKSAASMKRVYEGARVYVYADVLHKSLEDVSVDEVFVVPYYNQLPAMISNLQAQVHYCLSSHFDRRSLLVDADVIALRPAPFDEFPEPWDILVTHRSHIGVDDNGKPVQGVARMMPYNYGVIALENTHAAREAMIWVRERLKDMSPQLQGWYGNQHALRELVGGSVDMEVPRLIKRHIPWGQIDCRVEPCATWNYTPESADENFKGKYFAHVKGNRKGMFDAILEKAVA